MKNNWKQFAFKVTGGEGMVDEAIKLILETGVKLDSMCTYGGGFMGGGICTYFICFGNVALFRKAMLTHISHYNKNYQLPKLIEQLGTGKIDDKKYEKTINEWRIFRHCEIIDYTEDKSLLGAEFRKSDPRGEN